MKSVVGLLLAGLLASCATRPTEAPPAAPVAPRPAPKPAPAASAPPAADYVARMGSASLSLIDGGELCSERARDGSLRTLAGTIVADHKGISAQLSFAGRRLDLLPAAVARSEHQRLIDRLQAAGASDPACRQFLSAMVGEAAAVHAAYAERGESPTLRQVARMAAPITRAEWERLR